jgi:hypothetical protein
MIVIILSICAVFVDPNYSKDNLVFSKIELLFWTAFNIAPGMCITMNQSRDYDYDLYDLDHRYREIALINR